ncbi:hypothetical protein [Streptomyces sp. cg35]|uniref:hypothetical protein n=1 Tax=Streptomyces sp. cg35 TaxID=3421650 RepID=UPI003D1684A4
MKREVGRPVYRVGDVLRVSCSPASARVADVRGSYISVEWPWEKIDPDSRFRWNGQVAFPVDPGSWEWSYTLFRTEPSPQYLNRGDSCSVSIPETLVRVVDIRRHDPPLDLGRLPRPHTRLVVLPVDASSDALQEDEAATIEIESAAPIAMELVEQA